MIRTYTYSAKANLPAYRHAIVSKFASSVGTLISPAGRRARLCILIYHRVLPMPDPLLPTEPDVKTFLWQMQLVAEHFRVLPLSEAVERMRRADLPARAACITFDDGYADNVALALPILQQCGVPATFFVASGYLDGGRMWNDTVIEAIRRAVNPMLDLTDLELGQFSTASADQRLRTIDEVLSKLKYLPTDTRARYVDIIAHKVGARLPDNLMLRSEDVRRLSQAGMEIGAHTVNHPILKSLDNTRARSEIAAGTEQLAEIIRKPVRLFAYPNGKPDVDYDARHVRMVKELGFSAAVSTAWGAARRSTDIYQLPRFTPWDKTPMRFVFRLLNNCLRR